LYNYQNVKKTAKVPPKVATDFIVYLAKCNKIHKAAAIPINFQHTTHKIIVLRLSHRLTNNR